MDEESSVQMGFVQRRLPWIIAAVFFALYVFTVNRWVTSENLVVAAKVTGWDWSPQTQNPLLYLVTLPAQFLPVTLQLVFLNFLSAVLGSLTLCQLARSVSLLPHDRTRDQRQRERSDYSLLSLATAWLPPLFACLVCGLQLTFWEESTALTGEILSVFVFSFLVRCLLEFRLFYNDRWLFAFALVYGFAIPADWAFISYLPLFVCAVLWIKGVATLQPGFLLRMLGLGVIGLTTYLLLPLVILSQEVGAGSFMDLLKLQLGSQRTYLTGIPKTAVLLLSLTSILPVIVMGIRFPSSIGDVSVVGSMLSNFMFRAMHVLFLGACVWVAFDPAFSPRMIAEGIPVKFLTLTYLGCFAVGYFSGYILLVFGRAGSHSHRRVSRESRIINALLTGGLWLAFVIVPFGLLFKNLPLIRLANGPQLSSFSQSLLSKLPEGKALVLSDGSYQVMMVRAELARQGVDRDYIFVDIGSLNIGLYERLVRAELKAAWPNVLPEDRFPTQINVLSLLNLIGQISKVDPVCYLNSSFGLYFEVFYSDQQGLISRMEPYQEGQIAPPDLTEAQLAANETFWSDFESRLPNLRAGVASGDRGSLMIGTWVSRERNVWGVRLQNAGRYEEAGKSFESSIAWNPANTCAVVNLRQNALLRAEVNESGVAVGLSEAEQRAVQQNFGTYEQLLSANGPIDEAEFLALLAAEFGQGGNQRQAMLNYRRARELDSANLKVGLLYANTVLQAGFPGAALEEVGRIREGIETLEDNDRFELMRLEALGHYGLGNQAAANGDEDQQAKSFEFAEGILVGGLAESPTNTSFLETLSQVYLFTGRNAEALTLIDRHLVLEPGDPRLFQSKALCHMRLGQYREAIIPLDQVLEVDDTNAYARLNRAIAYFRLDEHASAKTDYLKVAEAVPNHYAVYFGLGRIAEAAGNNQEAIQSFERYIELAPKDTAEFQEVEASIQRLRE